MHAPYPELEEQSKDFWQERGDLWIRHHIKLDIYSFIQEQLPHMTM